MSLPEIATRDEWLAARQGLLAKEKDLTRRRDALNVERRNLPMVEMDKDYTFEGPGGTVRLIDMFEGRRQLIIYHFMFDPEWEDGCPSCTAGTDEISAGFLEHLHIRDTTYAMVSRAPLAKGIETLEQATEYLVAAEPALAAAGSAPYLAMFGTVAGGGHLIVRR